MDVSKVKAKKDDLYKVLQPILKAEAYGDVDALPPSHPARAMEPGTQKDTKEKGKKDRKNDAFDEAG